MQRLDERFRAGLDALRTGDGLRGARPVRPAADGRLDREGRVLVDFSSNDYLGLSRHPGLIERARAWTAEWGTGARASRLVTGTLDLHRAVEAKLARLKGCEAALLFGSGYQLNSTVLPALFDRRLLGDEPLVFTDRLIHASLHQGCEAAGARQIRFRHNDMDHLADLLNKHEGRAGTRFIVTESVFSMDGDRADLAAITDLAERHGAVIYLDEAHATGVLGPDGMGLAGEHPGRIEVVMGTFSKALGGFGAYVAGSQALCDYLVNRCRGFIYSTALPPAVLGAMDAALDLVPGMEAERRTLFDHAERLREGLKAAGIGYGASSTQIVPAILGEAEATLAASGFLEEVGLLGIAIRPPTVPKGSSRIRLAMNAAHTPEDMARLLAALPDLARYA